MPLNGIIHALREKERKKEHLDENIEGIVLQEFERRKFDGTHSSYDIVISVRCPENETHSGIRYSYIPLSSRAKISVNEIEDIRDLDEKDIEKKILLMFGYSGNKKNGETSISVHDSVYRFIKA